MKSLLKRFVFNVLPFAILAYMLVSIAPLDFTHGPMRGPIEPAHAQLFYPLGPYGNLGFSNSTFINTATIPAYALVGLSTGTPTAGATYTTDTATNICSLFPFVGSQAAGAGGANFSWDWYVKDTSAGAFTITAAGGSGVTMVGTGTATQNQMRHFKFVLNACPPVGLTVPTAAVTFYSLETAAF